MSRTATTCIPSDPRVTSRALALQSWFANRAGPRNKEGVFLRLDITMLKSRRVRSRSFSSSGVMETRFPQRYLTASPFLINLLAVAVASWVTMVYRLVVETSNGQSVCQILMYLRMWRLKSSFSRSVFKLLQNFRSPGSFSNAFSAFWGSLSTTTSWSKIAVMSSSEIPRAELYLDLFFRIIVQK